MQSHTKAHPADPVKQEVDAEQCSQHIDAVQRPVTDDDQTDQNRHRGGEEDHEARLAAGKLGREIDPHEPRAISPAPSISVRTTEASSGFTMQSTPAAR